MAVGAATDLGFRDTLVKRNSINTLRTMPIKSFIRIVSNKEAGKENPLLASERR
jgi:hypothetical protein